MTATTPDITGRKVRTQYGEIGTIIKHEPMTAAMNDILVLFDEGRGVYVEADRCWYALRCSTLLGDRKTCSPEYPMPKGASGQWEHTSAHEEGNGCSEGCCADYKCDDCGHEWRSELPQ